MFGRLTGKELDETEDWLIRALYRNPYKNFLNRLLHLKRLTGMLCVVRTAMEQEVCGWQLAFTAMGLTGIAFMIWFLSGLSWRGLGHPLGTGLPSDSEPGKSASP